MSAENPVSDLDSLRFRGDSASLTIPLVNPSTGASYTPTGPLLFTLKATDNQSDPSIIEKLSNVGGITLANPAVVSFVSDDASAVSVGVTYWWSIRDTATRCTVARGTLKFDSPIAADFALTIPSVVVNPASPYLSAIEIETNRAAAEAAAEQTALDRIATGADASATAADRTAVHADRLAADADASATALDRAQTALDRIATAADASATAADRAAVHVDRLAADDDAAATALDRAQTALDVLSAAQSAADALTAANPNPSAPTALGWDYDLHPFLTYRAGAEYRAVINPRDFVDQRIWHGPCYHVDSAAGSDANSGLGAYEGDFSAAKKGIDAAITAGNALAVPYRILVKAGLYKVPDTINGQPGGWPTPPTGALTEPTQPCAIIAWGGRVEHTTQLNITFASTPDATYTNTYGQTAENTVRVFDRLALDANGNFTELTRLLTSPDCNSTPNSWVQPSSTLRIHRADGLAPTNANTLVLASTYVARITQSYDFYLEGFDCYGGGAATFAAVNINGSGARNVVCVNCTFKYAGTTTNPSDGFHVENLNGLALLVSCRAEANWKDGFNFHRNGTGTVKVLTIGCSTRDNGRTGSSSNNGLTGHDDVIAIDIGGAYGPENNGATVHFIENSKLWCLGTTAVEDEALGNACYKASNSAILWLEVCTADAGSAGEYALHAQAAAGKIYKRNLTIVQGAEHVDSGATIATF